MTPLIPRIESARVGSILLAYLIRPGSDFRGDRTPSAVTPAHFNEIGIGSSGDPFFQWA